MDSDHLQEIEKLLDAQLSIVRDYVRGVADGHYNGLYVFGRPGSGKTYTVKITLDQAGVPYIYVDGHLTAMGLFDLLAVNPHQIIILDDVGHIFDDKIARQILMAALGDQPPKAAAKPIQKSVSKRKPKPKAAKPNVKDAPKKTATKATGERKQKAASNTGRIITYRRKGKVQSIHFTGAIIAISNIELHSEGVLSAVKSRVNTVAFSPTDEQMRVQILRVAKRGHTSAQGFVISRADCLEVAKFLIEASINLGVPLDLRNLTHKAFPAFIQWTLGKSENHWHDLVRHGLNEHAIQESKPTPPTRKGTKDQEHMIVRMLFEKYQDRSEIITDWCKQTGKSDRALYRRMSELGLKF